MEAAEAHEIKNMTDANKMPEKDGLDVLSITRAKCPISDSARLAAEDALLEQVILSVNPEHFKEFQAQLDLPPKPNTRLVKTMAALAPWERE